MSQLNTFCKARAISLLLLFFSCSHGNAQEFDKAITCSTATSGSDSFVMEWSDLRTNQILMDGQKYVDKSASPYFKDKVELSVKVSPTQLVIFHFHYAPDGKIGALMHHRVDRVSGKATLQWYDNPAKSYSCAPGKASKF